MFQILRAWSRKEAVGSGWALPLSLVTLFHEERCGPLNAQGQDIPLLPGLRAELFTPCPGPKLTALLFRRSAHYLAFCFILLKARKQVWVTLSTQSLSSGSSTVIWAHSGPRPWCGTWRYLGWQVFAAIASPVHFPDSASVLSPLLYS